MRKKFAFCFILHDQIDGRFTVATGLCCLWFARTSASPKFAMENCVNPEPISLAQVQLIMTYRTSVHVEIKQHSYTKSFSKFQRLQVTKLGNTVYHGVLH